MHRGYVKLWRKIHETGFLKNHSVLAMMIWSLTKATHKPYSTLVSGVVVDLEPGQFIFTRRNAAEDLGLSQRQVRSAFTTLVNTRFMTSRATSRFTIITIVKWDIYQAEEGENDQPTDQPHVQQATSKRPAIDPSTNTKEQKNEKNRRFVPPSVEEVAAYCLERNNGIDPEEFIDKMEIGGWVYGQKKTPVKDWQAVIRTWERFRKNKTAEAPSSITPQYEDASDYESKIMAMVEQSEKEKAEYYRARGTANGN